jgi:hemolysin activation/secretion protein
VSARLTAALFGVVGLLLPGAVVAQDFQQVAPKQPAQSQSGRIAVGPAIPAPQAATPNDGKVILLALRGLRFVPHASDVIKVGVTSAGLDTATVPGLDDPTLQAQLEAYIGKPLTFGDLHAITRLVIAYLRAHQRPLVDVAVPEQDVTTGVVQIVVTEFTLGRIKVRGNRYFPARVIEQGVENESGMPLDLDQLKHDLDWLNRNPFRKVDAVLARGETAGTTDIQLEVHDRFPLRVYAGYDNSGAPATGRDHWSLGFNLGDMFGLDQQFSYQFTAGDDFPRHITDGKARFVAHSISYIAPLPWHDLFEVFGSYARQSPDVGPNFGQVGQSAQVSSRYIHAFGGPSWLSQELQLGFDFKTTNNNLAFGGIQIFAASQDIDQFPLIYTATAVDRFGVTTVENDLVYSPGGITADNTNAAFALSGISFAKANYVYDTISLTRAMQLPYNASWVTRLKAQDSSGDLLSSEQLGGGGEDSVRGYDTRVVNGSQGVLINEELRSPPFAPLDWALGRHAGDSVQFLAFWDYARLSDPKTQPGNPDHFSLESAGVGVNYVVGRTLDLRMDYGWQLLKLPGAAKLGAQANIALTIGY